MNASVEYTEECLELCHRIAQTRLVRVFTWTYVLGNGVRCIDHTDRIPSLEKLMERSALPFDRERLQTILAGLQVANSRIQAYVGYAPLHLNSQTRPLAYEASARYRLQIPEYMVSWMPTTPTPRLYTPRKAFVESWHRGFRLWDAIGHTGVVVPSDEPIDPMLVVLYNSTVLVEPALDYAIESGVIPE